MSEPKQLVEHFFRHEYGRLTGLLVKRFGVQHLELVEDVVQTALWRGLQAWSRSGVPQDPAGWLYRTARNLATDALRRDKAFQRAALQLAQPDCFTDEVIFTSDDEVADEPLRLLFLCCHPAVTIDAQIALALKIVGGFSVHEIATGLLVSSDTIEKRISRAKAKLREVGEELAQLCAGHFHERLPAVVHVLYLMFNEGFAAPLGETPIKRDMCDEAIRLTRMVIAHPVLGSGDTPPPSAAALLALMLLHSARFTTRVDADQCLVLLADQDRSQWDWQLINEGMRWMLAAAHGHELSRYHIEAAIAWEHCRAPTFVETDWGKVTQLYRCLLVSAPGPMVRLNLAIAQSYSEDLPTALAALYQFSSADRRSLRPWWDCALAHLLERS